MIVHAYNIQFNGKISTTGIKRSVLRATRRTCINLHTLVADSGNFVVHRPGTCPAKWLTIVQRQNFYCHNFNDDSISKSFNISSYTISFVILNYLISIFPLYREYKTITENCTNEKKRCDRLNFFVKKSILKVLKIMCIVIAKE